MPPGSAPGSRRGFFIFGEPDSICHSSTPTSAPHLCRLSVICLRLMTSPSSQMDASTLGEKSVFWVDQAGFATNAAPATLGLHGAKRGLRAGPETSPRRYNGAPDKSGSSWSSGQYKWARRECRGLGRAPLWFSFEAKNPRASFGGLSGIKRFSKPIH